MLGEKRKVFGKKVAIIWDPLIDSAVNASLNNQHGKTSRVVNSLLKAMRETRSATASYDELMRAFYRLIDFHCMENDLEKAEALCNTLLKAQEDQYGVNDPRLMDTLVRVAKIRQLRKGDAGVSPDSHVISNGGRLIQAVSA